MTAHPVSVRAGNPADDAARDALVSRLPLGTIFHLSGWERTVEAVFGHIGRSLLAFRHDQLVGVLPLMQCPALIGPSSLISMPYGVYGGPLGVDAGAELALSKAAAEMARSEGLGRLEMRLREDPGSDWARSDLYATFVRTLPEDKASVLAEMPKKARAEARKARDRHGLMLGEGRWYLPDLIRLFHCNKQSLGSPGLPAAFFQALMDAFPGQVYVHLVHKESRPLAAVMSFSLGDTLYAYYSGTAAGADRDYSASNFMYLALQEWCVERGFRRFDFGRSRRGSGAFDFKRRQGFEAQELHYRYLLVRDRHVPSFTPSNPKTRAIRGIWSRLPGALARSMSSPAARYLP